MAYLIKFNQKKSNVSGFSLIELLLVIAIIGILALISTATYDNFKAASNLKIATNNLVEAFRYAQKNSQAVKSDSEWGVEILSDQVVIFKGLTYGTRDISSDQALDFPKNIIPSGDTEFVFEKLSGETNSGAVTITNNSGSINININEKGTITY